MSCTGAPDEGPFSHADVRAHSELAEWLDLWAPPLNKLTPSSFQLVRESSEIGDSIDYATFFGNAGLPTWQKERLIYSPDSAWAVDFWFLQVTDAGQFLGDPDSHIALVHPGNHQAFQILDCGTPCGFHVVAWLTRTSFLVGGWAEAFDIDMDHIRPVVWRYDLDVQRVREFQGPPLGRNHLATMDVALHNQWRSRFPWLRWEQSN